jgi:cytochrome P450
MLHDPEMYSEPEAFKPERFVNLSKDDSKAMDPRNFAFGFGRRICVGALFADNALFIALVTILSTFDIRKKTINGNEVIPEVEYTDFVGQPKPFVCDVVFRSLTARTLIDAAVDAGRE